MNDASIFKKWLYGYLVMKMFQLISLLAATFSSIVLPDNNLFSQPGGDV